MMTENPYSEENLPKTLQEWHKRWEAYAADWVEEAEESYDLVAGNQWSDEDKQAMEDMLRPAITFNRVGPFVDAVSGLEISNRQEVRFIPREVGDVGVNDLLTSAADWVRDLCDAEDEETDAFIDLVTCGMGWTETRMDYEEDPEGMILIERRDPLEMRWDTAARKRNLSDAKWVMRDTYMSLEDVRARWPEKADEIATATTDYPAGDNPHDAFDAWKYENDQGSGESQPTDREVKVSHAQWWERKPFYKVLSEDGIIEIDASRWSRLKQMFPQLRAVRVTKRVYREAFMAGRTILQVGDCPCDSGFTLKCMTGKRDRNNNTWYGLVRAMKDPQKWANKFFSSVLEKIGSQGEGVIAETGVFKNERKAEAEWANPNKITWAKPGTLADGKIQPKPKSPVPNDLTELMAFSVGSFKDVSGVNLELMGLTNKEQPGVLEAQRKQAGITMLSWCFDSLRRYRKEQGRGVLMQFIRDYISDGRLVKIKSDTGEQYIQLLREHTTGVYDVIVDESPSSPNQKERVWSILQTMIPALAQIGMPAPPEIIDYLPLPETMIEAWKKKMQPNPQQQQMEQQQWQQAMAEQAAKIKELESKVALNQAKAQGEQVDAQVEAQKAGVDAQVAQSDNILKISQARKNAAETGKALAGE